jgi:tyrosinase
MTQSELVAFTFEVVSTQAKIPNGPTKPIRYSEEVVKHPEVTIGKAGGVAA